MAEEGRQEGVVFQLAGLALAVPLGAVVRAVRAVAVTPLPEAPAIVRGIIDVHGEIVPVVDIRERLGLPARELEWDDHILIVRSPRRPLALPVDRVGGLIAWRDEDLVAAAPLAPGTKHLKGILKDSGGLVLLQDLEAFLSTEEQDALDETIRHARTAGGS
ncbi:MAG: chemotaxis protein CheW [Candidatus Bathyarchaeota archaeon]